VGSLPHGIGGLVVIFGSPMVFTLVSKGFVRNLGNNRTTAGLDGCVDVAKLILFRGSIINALIIVLGSKGL